MWVCLVWSVFGFNKNWTQHIQFGFCKITILIQQNINIKHLNIERERESDENQQAFKDPLHVPVGPITRARSKKIKEALNGLIQEIWADSNVGHSKLGPKEYEGVINLIQAIEGWSTLIGRDLWRGLMADWLSRPILVNSHFSYSGAYYFRLDLS